MANIGEVIPPEEENEQAPAIGTAITSDQVLRPTKIQEEVMKTPQWGAMKDWIKKPENLMTTLVFLASMAQNRRPGQSSLAAFGERAVGTMAFRHGLGASQREEVRKQEEENRKQAALEAEAQHRKETINVQREQLTESKRHNQATEENTRTMVGLQAGVAGMNDATERWKAELNRDLQLGLAKIERDIASIKEGDLGLEMSDKDFVNLLGAAAAMGEFGEAPPVDQLMVYRNRLKISARPDLQKLVGYQVSTGPDGRQYVDVSPQYRAMFGIPGGGPQATPPTPTPAPMPTAARPQPTNYTPIPQPAPAMGLPNPLLGQS